MSAPTPAAPNSALACPLCGVNLLEPAGECTYPDGGVSRWAAYVRSDHNKRDCAQIAEQAAEIARLRAELDDYINEVPW